MPQHIEDAMIACLDVISSVYPTIIIDFSIDMKWLRMGSPRGI